MTEIPEHVIQVVACNHCDGNGTVKYITKQHLDRYHSQEEIRNFFGSCWSEGSPIDQRRTGIWAFYEWKYRKWLENRKLLHDKRAT